MKFLDVGIISDINLLRNKKIVIYGTGYWGKKIYEILQSMGIDILYAAKTTAVKGERFCNCKEIKQISVITTEINCPEYLVLVCSHQYREEMLAHLEALGFGADDGAGIVRLRAVTTAVLMNAKETITSNLGGNDESSRNIPLYREMHTEQEQYGIGGGHYLPLVSCFLNSIQPKTILDYGCGKGLFVELLKNRYPSCVVAGYDPAIQGKDILTMKKADFLICTDVLEHVPEEDLPSVMDKISSISGNCFLGLYHGMGDILPNGENAHCTIKPIFWYYDLLRQYFPHVTCLPIDSLRTIVVTFKVQQEELDKYMRVMSTGLFI